LTSSTKDNLALSLTSTEDQLKLRCTIYSHSQ